MNEAASPLRSSIGHRAWAMLRRSDVPVAVQHTRLDSRERANALLSTVAFPVEP